MKIYAGQAESWRNQCAGLAAIRAHRLAIFIDLGIKAARSPTAQDFLQRGFIHAEKIGERFQIWRERYDRAHIQIAVRPTIAPFSDAWREGIVNRRVTNRAAQTNRFQASRFIKESLYADHSVQFEKRDSGGRIVEIHF